MTKIIGAIVLVAALVFAGWWWMNRPADMPTPGGETASNSSQAAPDTTSAIEKDLDAAAVAEIDAEFSEIDNDINSL